MRVTPSVFKAIFITASLLASTASLGQSAPATDIATQEFLRQQERDKQLRAQQSNPTVRLDSPLMQPTGRIPAYESPCFNIQRILLTGSGAKEFSWALPAANFAGGSQTPQFKVGSLDKNAPKNLIEHTNSDPASGRCLGTKGINTIMARVQNAIVRGGFITTRVLAQPQDLSTGELQLSIVSGKVRAIKFEDRTSKSAMLLNAVPIAEGDLLNLRDIEQGLENFKRVPTADADIQIVPSTQKTAQPGDSDLNIKWVQGFPLRISASFDDSGSKATGRYQGSATLSCDHCGELNDLFYLSMNQDFGGSDPGQRGTQAYSAHYSLPMDYWLLGFNVSKNKFNQTVIGSSQTYLYSGESQNRDIKLSRLVYRNADRKSSVSLRGWYRSSENFVDDTEVILQRRRMAGWELGWAHQEFFRFSTLDLNVSYKRGTAARHALTAPEEASGEGTSRPRIITADLQVNTPLRLGENTLRHSFTARAQNNHTPLVPQDRFSIGGRYSVRGFDGESSLSADEGWLVKNELSLSMGATGQSVYLGVDYGEVKSNPKQQLIGEHLCGLAIGARGNIKRVSYDIFVGQALSKPQGFTTSDTVAGFNLNWSY